jgi:hypothetical protein
VWRECRVAQRGERLRIPLAREDRAHNALPGPSAQIADDIRLEQGGNSKTKGASGKNEQRPAASLAFPAMLAT